MAEQFDFTSDNAASVHPAIWAALAAADRPDRSYDGDALSQALNGAFSALFGTPCDAIWLTTGTAANSIALAHQLRPYQAVLCHAEAHIEVDECGAPGFFAGGAKLLLVDGPSAKLTPAGLAERLAAIRPDVHQVQPGAIAITNASEYGASWTPGEVAAIGDIARQKRLKLHMDGARFANAIAHVGCHPAEVTWRAGVDSLAFGFTKNGAMLAEALIFFTGDAGPGLREWRKRSGHLLSKGRFVAAQILAMLSDDLWLTNARAANAGAAAIAAACPGRLLHPVQANEVFVRLSAAEAAALRAAGFGFHDWGPDAARLVVSWDQSPDSVGALAAALAALDAPCT